MIEDYYSIIGYSGHAYVVLDSLVGLGIKVTGYFELNEKLENPYRLDYLGVESSENLLEKRNAFACIGSNNIRCKVIERYNLESKPIIDSTGLVSNLAIVDFNSYVGRNATVNSKAIIGNGVIINTGSIVEHECIVGDYTHIAPGAVLCGNVLVGKGTLIGANSTVLPGVHIGNNCVVGAGSVVTKDIPDNSISFGNPNQVL